MNLKQKTTKTEPKDELYLKRCLELARLGASSVATNPLVGAIVVHQNQIIGEGYHALFGGKHAEVVAIENVKDQSLLSQSTLYVSLEPCCIVGKTPPCVELILKKKIPRVIIGCLDPNPKINGKGVTALRENGVEVVLAQNPEPFVDLIRFFTVNQFLERPYILLKWAETANGIIGRTNSGRLIISGETAQRYVHFLRSHYQAILVGKNTALRDNPSLNVRYYPGKSPIPIIFDLDKTIPKNLTLFQTKQKVIVITRQKYPPEANITYFCPASPKAFMDLSLLIKELYQEYNIGSIMVEGGRYVLQQFINQDLYDELQIIRSPLNLSGDVAAPLLLHNFKFDNIKPLGNDYLFTKTAQRF